MRCPFCSHVEDKVVDSRLSREGEVIRRRRECLSCERRYTTYERVEGNSPMVIKKDGRREMFERQKILQGMKKACEKRPISVTTIEEAVSQIEKKFQETGEAEIPSHLIGEEVMRKLNELDPVAYVRFASVYREFKDISEFMNELKDLLKDERKEKSHDPERK
ncbi:MAG TPA: transcriptional regulator NrdR [Nitrospiria bacterium]|nr:transcriptional regulator NrdR [Nitrospiria bacterium]